MRTVLPIILLAYAGSAGAAGWYPRAGETCAEYSANVFRDNAAGSLPTAPAKDPAVAGFIADFNAANGPMDANGAGSIALMALLDYCDSHPANIVGQITAHEVITDIKATVGRSPAAPQSAQMAETWGAALTKCLTDTAAKYSVMCKGAGCDPDRLAFTTAWAEKAYCGYTAMQSQAAQHLPPLPLIVCLQDAARQSTAACQEAGCSSEGILFVIGGAQMSRCGYTALRRMSLPVSMPKGNVANCSTIRDDKGEWTTTCEGTTRVR